MLAGLWTSGTMTDRAAYVQTKRLLCKPPLKRVQSPAHLRNAALALWPVLATPPLRFEERGQEPDHIRRVEGPRHVGQPLPGRGRETGVCHRATHRPPRRERTGHWRLEPCLATVQEP